jgi:hypothetical protein
MEQIQGDHLAVDLRVRLRHPIHPSEGDLLELVIGKMRRLARSGIESRDPCALRGGRIWLAGPQARNENPADCRGAQRPLLLQLEPNRSPLQAGFGAFRCSRSAVKPHALGIAERLYSVNRLA